MLSRSGHEGPGGIVVSVLIDVTDPSDARLADFVGLRDAQLRRADGGRFRHYDVGLEHLAILVDTREELDEIHERCVALGAEIHFPPQEDRDIPGYWELFVFDPDGLRIGAAYYPPDVVVQGTR